MAAPQASSRLEMLQARFQQKQLQEKEQKLLQLYDQQQQRAYQVVQRGSAGSNSSHHGSTAVRTATTTTATTTTSTSQGGKVRQMFDERRQTTVKGIDRSYPLEPLENKLRKQTNMNGAATQRNGNVTVNRQSVKRVARADVNSNVNGGKPVVSYHEEIIRDSFGPSVRRHDDEDEYGVENRVATFASEHYRHENDNEQYETLDQDMIDRNRMMAKIHLMGFDESLKHRVKNDLESEEFPEYLMVDVPDKLSKKNVTRKLSQAEERLERFKNANAKRSSVTKQSTSTSTVTKKRAEPAIPKSNSRLRNRIAETSPISARSGSSWISERSQRIFESAKSPAGTRAADEISARWKESSDTETLGRRASPRSLLSKEATKVETASRFYPRINGFKSLTSDGKIFVRRRTDPQFFCRESERSATTVSLNRKSDSPLFRRNELIKRNGSPRFSLSESERSRGTSESKSPVWSETRVSSRQSASPEYLRYESKRSGTATSTDRETIESKSSEMSRGSVTKRNMINSERQKNQTSTLGGRRSFQFKPRFHEEGIFKKRNTSPQFFCKESERSATTMSIDRKSDSSGSPLFRRDTLIKRNKSPRFFLSESEQSHRRSESKSPIWSDGELLSIRSTSPQYRESKRFEIAGIGRGTVESKSGDLNERNLTRLTRLFEPARSAITASIDRKYNTFKSSEMTRDRRVASPQFFCKESEKSATTMLIEPKSTDTAKSIAKQRKYASNNFQKQPVRSPIDKKISYVSTKYRRTPSPSVTKYEVISVSPKGRITETRRSPKISESSATSVSSIVNLKYGLELDNNFQSTELVRKFIKSQDGRQRATRQLPSKRIANGNHWKNQRKPSPMLRTASPWSVEGRKRTTPEFSRKTITPTEADVDIQEITMTDHRIERGKLQKASSPISRRQFDGTHAKLLGSGTEFKTSATYPARKLHEQRKSTLKSDVFKKSLSDRESSNPRSDQESEKSVTDLIRRSATKPQTVAEPSSNKELKGCRKISSPNSVRRTARKKIFFCETIHTPVKSSASGKTISPTRECGRRHDIKSKVSSSRVSPLRKTAEISRDTPTVFSSWSIATKADQSKRRSTEGRSPTCKRRLFEFDSDKENLLKLTLVRVRKDESRPFINFRLRGNEAVSSLKSSEDFNHDVTRNPIGSEGTSAFDVKPLRSIEDIRKSIDKNSKLNTAEKSRSAIANRRSALRESVNARRSSTAASAASNVFLGANPVKLINIKSCVSRITKSPSPDSAAIKQRETNARTTRGSISSSPSKSPEVASRRPASESRNQEAKLSRRSTFAKGTNSSRNKMTESDTTDGVILQNGSANESTRKSDSFMIDFDDRPSKEDDAVLLKRSLMKKSSNEKQQTTSSVSGRPTSSSNPGVNLIQDSIVKNRMAENERGKGVAKGGGKVKNKAPEKPSSSSGKFSNASGFNDDTTTDTKGLTRCKTCGRSFAQNRIGLHEEICMKTTTKKRKQFDPVMSRVKGTELEPFVKKGFAKRETKKKPEAKSDWRRKHEEFISAIRYARETQAQLAAGGNLSDLPPPPPSDTSDYIQCEHCGRKFNRSAAERHIPICKRMHDKKQTQAPRARR